MNDSDTIVGVYLGSDGNYHAFQRTVDGNLFTFDYPGAVSTHAEGINNAGTINGYFTDSSGNAHGFFGGLGYFTQYDISGAANSLPRGINGFGTVAGSIGDSSGVMHGFAVQLCAVNVTNLISVTSGAVNYNSATGEYVQTVTLKNTGTTAITGPLYLLFGSLPAGVFPANANGISTCAAPPLPRLPRPRLSPWARRTRRRHPRRLRTPDHPHRRDRLNRLHRPGHLLRLLRPLRLLRLGRPRPRHRHLLPGPPCRCKSIS